MTDSIKLSIDELRKLGLTKTDFSSEEIKQHHIVRISYLTEEMREAGVKVEEDSIITSHDPSAREAVQKLQVEISEANMPGIVKWQLPIPKAVHQEVIQRTSFAPKSIVGKHSHPKRGESAAFRFVISGAISLNGKEFRGGDWFYIPPNTEYSLEVGDEGAEILHLYHAVCPRFEIDPFHASS